MTTRASKSSSSESVITDRRSEDVTLEPGECPTWVLLDEATVDLLANGICTEALAERMWRLKGTERAHVRVRAAKLAKASSK